jgi:hypothetical protein
MKLDKKKELYQKNWRRFHGEIKTIEMHHESYLTLLLETRVVVNIKNWKERYCKWRCKY